MPYPSPPAYVIFRYNIHSISDEYTNQQCVDMLDVPWTYKIVDDKPIYDHVLNLTDITYERKSVTTIDDAHVLFTGMNTFEYQSKKHTTDCAFVLDTNAITIQGHETVRGACASSIIGTETTKNQW